MPQIRGIKGEVVVIYCEPKGLQTAAAGSPCSGSGSSWDIWTGISDSGTRTERQNRSKVTGYLRNSQSFWKTTNMRYCRSLIRQH